MINQDVFDFIKDWLWAPLMAALGWMLARNQKEHDMLWKANAKRLEEIAAVRKDTGDSHSKLMDRVLTHVDTAMGETTQAMRTEDEKIYKQLEVVSGHIDKLFQNADKDRTLFRDMLMNHTQRSEDRHLEVLRGQQEILNTIHTGLAGKVDK